MADHFDLIVSGGTCVGREVAPADLGLSGGLIAAIGDLSAADANERLDATGLHVLPGLIDSHVHLREPGLEHKEDFETGTLAALLGGVTAVVDMPNTYPPTVDVATLADKRGRAAGRVHCDIGFYAGATPENLGQLGQLEREPGCAGIKLFMGRSSGGLLVDSDEGLERALGAVSRPLAVHAEDEARLRERLAVAEQGQVSHHPEWRDAETAWKASKRVLETARKLGKRVHLLHVSTQEEVELMRGFRDVATAEVTPQHLVLDADSYVRLGSRAQMNPPIRGGLHRVALWQGILEGLLDCIGSDHAPHTLAEKAFPYPQSPSGMPGVQTMLPVLLDRSSNGWLPLRRLAEAVSGKPAQLLGLSGRGRLEVGAEAHLTLVDLKEERVVEDSAMASRCGWTPFAGEKLKGWPRAVVLRGKVAMRDGEAIGAASGQVLSFSKPAL